MIAWPCGHTEVLELAWLPDERLRRRRTEETMRHGACLRCPPPPGPPANGAAGVATDGEAEVLVSGGPAVTSWGRKRVAPGGRVAAGPGSHTVLAGGTAAVTGGLLVALAGRAVVDAGARVLVADDARDVELWLLPWARIQAGNAFRTVTAGLEVVDATGAGRPTDRPLPADLTELLEASRDLGPRP
ncbi:hypothetical protein [Actinomyces sp.]|uniref:hypothetical protein n=1 Tax=Actinomyces sp. TaxID=29317 RepID=UPI0026DD03D9|nr:hypothetical protein [Actinomyces sp.]MDO4899453.1 hypothetical protein [Actinomyces sp.]